MKESAFQGWVVDTAQRLGWKVWHVPTPMRPIGGNKFVPDQRGRGLPDLVMLHADPPRLILAELKNEEGVLSDEQREFLRLARGVADDARHHALIAGDVVGKLGCAPVGVYTWRPGAEEIIEAILRGKVMVAA
jgi:hypothetical protein